MTIFHEGVLPRGDASAARDGAIRENAAMIRDRLSQCRWHAVGSGFVCIAAMAAAAGVAAVAPQEARAQAPYPNKPIRIVVGFAAGGPTDIIARVVGAKLGDILGQQVYVENRAGASGNIATETVARAGTDGYTLLMASLANAVNESLYKNLRYKLGDDLVPVAPIAETANVLLVHPSLDVKSVADLVALAKARPGEVLYATAGKGTATHLAAELFNMTAGLKMIPVHYKGGGETIKDLVSGQVKVMFSTIPPVLGFVRNGTLRGLATTGPKRDQTLPDLPTVAEAGLAGYDVRLWFGLVAPADTARDVVDRLSAATNKALNSPELKAALAAQGYDPLIGTPGEFGAYYRGEVDKWGKVIAAVGTIGD
jgi:tripartite-type tricarboxylate transporter receptor subunit TctC